MPDGSITIDIGTGASHLLLTCHGWLDGVSYVVPSAKAREIAQALNEYALAVEQPTAAGLVALDPSLSPDPRKVRS